MHFATRRRFTISVAVIGIIGAVTLVLGFRPRSQQLRPSPSTVTDTESQQIENSVDQLLRVLENDDSPVRILDAKVKEISGPNFTKLTGKNTNFATICSVPQVRLLNSSGKPITGFVLAVRDPTTKTTRGIVQSKVLIDQGQVYTVDRQVFIEPEWTSTLEGGQIRSRFEKANIHSDKYWISFATRAELFVTVARVTFQDGSIWKLKEGGDIQ